MESSLQLVQYAFLSLLFIILAAKFFLVKSKSYRLPPSPKLKFPIFGHLYLLRGKAKLHRTLYDISQKLGSVFSLEFGSRLVVVVSSPCAAEECFTKNDIILANRPHLILGKHYGYNYTTMTHAPYGDHWRNLRRIGTSELFSTIKLNMFSWIRGDEVNRMLRRLAKNSCHEFARVELKSNLSELSFNVTTRMIGGERYFADTPPGNHSKAKYAREILKKVLSSGGASHVNDYVPFLRWIDYKGYEKGVEAGTKEWDKITAGIIDDHRRGPGTNSMVDKLLLLQKTQPHDYSDSIIKGLLTVLIPAGTDTSSVTIEWAMYLLIHNPRVLRKARDEIDSIVGHDRLLEESDLPGLPYLQNVVSETFRLFPAAPLLVPREASADCVVQGYDVPKGTIVLFNVWSIHKDDKVWDDPMSFKPERFETEESYAYKLIPFGLGRRGCPGVTLAMRIVGLSLGSLIQCFEWETTSDDEEIDIAEGTGLTIPKIKPLEAMCKARPIINKVLA